MCAFFRALRVVVLTLAVTAGVLTLAPLARATDSSALAPIAQAHDFLLAFGSTGSADGQFSWPYGVAVDPANGDVYVTDYNNNRVEKFDSSGNYLSQIGGYGTGNGQFDVPYAAAVDPANGDLYVVDTVNDRVQKFDSSGNYLLQFGSFGHGDGQFWAPLGVVVDPANGDVYVADSANYRVQKFDSSGNYLSQFGSVGAGNGQFNEPFGLAVDPATSNLYVADLGNQRVQKFDSSGNYLSKFGDYGMGDGQFTGGPYGVAVNPLGDVYVTASDRVQEFDSSGNYLSQFGSSGTGDGQFNLPIGVAVDPATGDVYVADARNDRVQKFGVASSATVTGVSPGNGPLGGGTSVTITGTGLTGATAVDFGANAATIFTVNGDTSITAVSPAASSVGTVDVTVTASASTSATSAADHFSYVYAFTGYQAPVANQPVLNGVNAGRGIPMKFSLGANLGLGIIAPGYPTVTQIDCGSGALVNNATETLSAGGSGLTYDPTTGTYTYVWKTGRSMAGTCRQFDLRLTDGTDHLADFTFR